MSIKSDLSGLDKLKDNMNELVETKRVLLIDIFTSDFLLGCSSFSSFEEFIEASGFKVESEEDFEAIPGEDMDDFVSSNTTYSSWQDMLQAAGVEHAKKQLFKGL